MWEWSETFCLLQPRRKADRWQVIGDRWQGILCWWGMNANHGDAELFSILYALNSLLVFWFFLVYQKKNPLGSTYVMIISYIVTGRLLSLSSFLNQSKKCQWYNFFQPLKARTSTLLCQYLKTTDLLFDFNLFCRI